MFTAQSKRDFLRSLPAKTVVGIVASLYATHGRMHPLQVIEVILFTGVAIYWFAWILPTKEDEPPSST